jgi:hypothetical protein
MVSPQRRCGTVQGRCGTAIHWQCAGHTRSRSLLSKRKRPCPTKTETEETETKELAHTKLEIGRGYQPQRAEVCCSCQAHTQTNPTVESVGDSPPPFFGADPLRSQMSSKKKKRTSTGFNASRQSGSLPPPLTPSTPAKQDVQSQRSAVFALKQLASSTISGANAALDGGRTVVLSPEDFRRSGLSVRAEVLLQPSAKQQQPQTPTTDDNSAALLQQAVIACVKPLQSAALKPGQAGCSSQLLAALHCTEGSKVTITALAACNHTAVVPATRLHLHLQRAPSSRGSEPAQYLQRLPASRRTLLEKAATFTAEGLCVRPGDALSVSFEGLQHEFAVAELEPSAESAAMVASSATAVSSKHVSACDIIGVHVLYGDLLQHWTLLKSVNCLLPQLWCILLEVPAVNACIW